MTSLRVSADGPPPATTRPVDRPMRGSLVICGGGSLPASVVERFMELAGGEQARIVVIPTAGSDPIVREDDDCVATWRARGAASVTLLHTRSRAEANEPSFSDTLDRATGVWLGGGDQLRLSQSYVDTEVERRLKDLLDRGGVIGGTSAGAAIMTRVMIEGGRTRAREGRGFDFLPGSVIDQHFLKRNRMGRLLGLLADHPGLVGFGIDEGTALVLRGDRLTVVGSSYVVACLPATPDRPNGLHVLNPGDEMIPPWLTERGEVAMSSSDHASPATADASQIADPGPSSTR